MSDNQPKKEKPSYPKISEAEANTQRPTCGIIMPISTIDGCTENHWIDVLDILKDICNSSGFTADLVSNAEDTHVIQKTIVENIYSSDIVICDVSCKNANVMFELGMRLAFDKPTIIIKDDKTGYSFDTSVIEHLEYPRDLRFSTIISFKEKLSSKLKATFAKSHADGYSSFLKNFGQYKIAKLHEETISSETYIVKKLQDIEKELKFVREQNNLTRHSIKGKSSINLVESNINFDVLASQILRYISENNVIIENESERFDRIAQIIETITLGKDLSIDEIKYLTQTFIRHFSFIL